MDAPVFKIIGSKITLIQEAIQITEYLSQINEKQLKYIILTYDYCYSPYRKKPFKQRKIMASRKIWPDYVDFVPEEAISEKSDIFKKAIDEYKGLIYDSKRHQLDNIVTKIELLNDKVFTTESGTDIKALATSIDFLEKRKDDLIGEIERDDDLSENVQLTKDLELSLVEKLKRKIEMKKRLGNEDVTI